jgi:hypothetical protein
VERGAVHQNRVGAVAGTNSTAKWATCIAAERRAALDATDATSWRGSLGQSALARPFYLLLADAASETFARQSPVRWWVVAIAALYLGGTAELWRRRHASLQRLGWPPSAVASFFVLSALIVFTAWLPGGLQNGLALVGLPTSVYCRSSAPPR